VDHGNDIVSFKANNELHTGAAMIFEKTNTGAWQQFKITSVAVHLQNHCQMNL